MGGSMGGMATGGMGAGILFGVVVWLLIVTGLAFVGYALVSRWWGTDRRPTVPGDHPLAIARIRYSRGEISRDEFLQIQRDLQDPPRGAP